MKSWQDEQISALFDSSCERSYFEAVVSFARALGFEYCAYGLRLPIPLVNPRVITHSNYSPEWRRKYHAEGYLSIDPTVHHGTRSLSPVIWSDELFASAPAFWEDARSFGLKVGWAQACRDVNGTGGMLTLARSAGPLTSLELAENSAKMLWLAHTSHAYMSKRLSSEHVQEAEVRLSGRELTALRWTAEGKTSSEISDILGISERTVNFHIANAMAKLNASNKTSAVVRAALLGMLY